MSVVSAINLEPAVLGGGGGGSQNLSQVLTTGNSAGSSDIDMNNNNITSVDNIGCETILCNTDITCATLNYTTLNPPVGGGGGATILLNTPAQQTVTITTGLYTSPAIYTINNVPIGLVQFSVEILFENVDTAPVTFNNIQFILNTSVTNPNLVFELGDFNSNNITASAGVTNQKIYTWTYYNTAVQNFTFQIQTNVTSGAFATAPPQFFLTNALMYKLA
jgi:hypothetical protein